MEKVLRGDIAAESRMPMKHYGLSSRVPLPDYLERTYWWAYLHPNAVRFFERQWLINLILWGNYRRLQDAALREMGSPITGKVLQIACVYGDLTERLATRLGAEGHVDVVDVAPVQLENLKRKINGHMGVSLYNQDSAALAFADGSYDYVVVFFLLHEQPESARIRTVQEALRVVKPGGRVIFVDYHRPGPLNPFRYLMAPVLALLEPFAMGMWLKDITDWMPVTARSAAVEKRTYFGGLYQKVVVTV